jgi:hypothetical protein
VARAAWGRKSGKRVKILCRVILAHTLLAAILLCAWDSTVLAQEGSETASRPPDIMGLDRGERDTMRVDYRLGGKEERDSEARLSKERIGPDDMRIRREARETDLLRSQAELRMRTVRRERSDEARASAQRKLNEQIQENRREFRFENLGAD